MKPSEHSLKRSIMSFTSSGLVTRADSPHCTGLGYWGGAGGLQLRRPNRRVLKPLTRFLKRYLPSYSQLENLWSEPLRWSAGVSESPDAVDVLMGRLSVTFRISSSESSSIASSSFGCGKERFSSSNLILNVSNIERSMTRAGIS